MFLKEKCCGKIKGHGCANSHKQWAYLTKEVKTLHSPYSVTRGTHVVMCHHWLLLTILEWIPAMVDTVPLIIWLVYFCFNEELSLLPKNPTEAKLQATSTRGESTEPT
jgi:hypothetical protein